MAAFRRIEPIDIIANAAVTLVTVLCIIPFLYVVSISLTDPDVYVPFRLRLFPQKVSFEIYRYILSTPAFLSALKSTVYITVVGTAINILVTFSMAYGLTKRGLPHRRLLMAVVIFALLFDVGLIPNYLLVRSLGLMNTYWALILPVATNAWSLIVARSFLDSIPGEIEESAKVDGASDITIFLRIVMPLSMAAIATLTLFFAVAHWNQYIRPLIYITDTAKRTLQVYVRALVIDASVGGVGNAMSLGREEDELPSETIRLATVVLAMLPILVVYPFLQRYFMKGVMLGSVKG